MRPLCSSEQDFSCDTCNQPAGQPCRLLRAPGIAKSPHANRVDKWFKAGVADGSIRTFAVQVFPDKTGS